MKKSLLFVFTFLVGFCLLHAEEYLNGKLVTSNKVETNILYDRTQWSISSAIFQSVYKVFSTEKKLLYTVTITHDRQKAVLFFALKSEGAGVKGFTVKYNPDSSGLIFNDINNVDTSFDGKKAFRYLFSFADTALDFPILHQIKTDDGGTLLLDPLSRIRLKMHKDVLRKLFIVTNNPSTQVLAPKEVELNFTDALSRELYEARMDLVKLNTNYTAAISEIRNTIQLEIYKRFKNNKVFADEVRYSGDLRKGRPEGAGLMVDKGNIYQGNFKDGKFEQGTAAIKTVMFDYIGQYANGAYNGIGWLKYANGSYLLGEFTNGALAKGISLSKDKEGEIYYGSYKNGQRTGYGELRNNNGDLYFGEFLNGKLIKGYTKEVDQFGYAIYSKIENKTKSPIGQQIAEEFFDAVLRIKN
jgi:hypothetical protein